MNGAAHTLGGTIAQPVADKLSGGAYSLIGGFWSLGAIRTSPLKERECRLGWRQT
jgi:hypothetical protein